MRPGKMLPGKVLPGKFLPRNPEICPPGKIPPGKMPPTPPSHHLSPPIKKYFVKVPHVIKYLNGENFVNFNFRQS